ncbi:hypothetical protein CGCSCA4_v014756 [Colletotrichum siamense]|uniref:Uncharacterized protein n=1 Tax=Colletotrichum siamense TaxID=690259 RepID=A0A9P5EJC4_COLSI|nr:hypothetical protein CGCSCA4_v014756 [Colletotrichum siamense]KAF4845057.1 hypothetical protein CGCSCA2_v013766 [Colletotrichum siamense]
MLKLRNVSQSPTVGIARVCVRSRRTTSCSLRWYPTFSWIFNSQAALRFVFGGRRRTAKPTSQPTSAVCFRKARPAYMRSSPRLLPATWSSIVADLTPWTPRQPTC